MRSSAGLRNPQLRAALLLVAVPLAALLVALGLAFAFSSVTNFGANEDEANRTTVEARFGTQGRPTTAKTPSAALQPPSLWALLTPWVVTVDAIAVLGLAVVIVVRSGTQRRRGA